MSKSRFLLLSAAVFTYFGLIILSVLVAYPYGMIALVIFGGSLLLAFEAVLNRAPRKSDESSHNELMSREPLKFL